MKEYSIKEERWMRYTYNKDTDELSPEENPFLDIEIRLDQVSIEELDKIRAFLREMVD